MHLTGLVARIAYAVLAAIIAFIIVYLLAVLAATISAEMSDLLKRFAVVIAILTGIVYFFARPAPNAPIV